MVSNYSGSSCNYSYTKLKNHLYLVNEEYSKYIYIDNGEAYVSGLTIPTLKVEGFNINFNEQISLDERYKFQKTITISMRGYVKKEEFEGKHFAIIESIDGTLWMVNVDFPSRITYTFNLSEGVCQTDFTFSSLSNYPTLKLTTELNPSNATCLGYAVNGIEKLELLEKDYVALDVQKTNLSTTEEFKVIEFLKKSCSFSEVFDGDKYTSTISFNILFDNNQPSWQYNLIEFLQNRYAAIITAKGYTFRYFVGFDTGLIPTYNIQTGDNGSSDLITITLTEASTNLSTTPSEIVPEIIPTQRYRYVRRVDDINCYECVGLGQAMYLVKQQVDALGNPTDRYLVMEGYEGEYDNDFNVVGVFSEEELFDTNICKDGQRCIMDTTIPSVIDFEAVTALTELYMEASCDWYVEDVPYGITVSPMSGNAEGMYFVTITNSIVPTDTLEEMKFKIRCCSRTKTVKIRVGKNIGCILPQIAYIDCNAQTVQFIVKGICTLRPTSIDPTLTYSQDDNYFYVDVPLNTGNDRIYTISATNCNCSDDVISFSIVQSKPYEKWVEEGGYICSGDSSYTVERKYTGTTSDNITGATSETRPKTLIKSGDTRCGATSEFIFDGHYYCINGDKLKALEEVINGRKTGITKLGEMVEASSSFCQQTTSYKWELSDKYQCTGDGHDFSKDYFRFRALENGTFKFNGTSANTVQYSIDSGSNWITLANNTNSPTVQSGNEIWWKSTMAYEHLIGRFSSSGRFNVEGNIMSLLYGDNFRDKTDLTGKIAVFDSLFSACTGVTSAENLILPATTLDDACYSKMFLKCSSLTLPPKILPATTLVDGCYYMMFQGCTSLTSVPELPATTLAPLCYTYMFSTCKSLTKVPNNLLPVTALTQSCYEGMFEGCTSLITAPELPATTMANGCYRAMFAGCSSLTTAPELPATTLAEGCYSGMFGGLAYIDPPEEIFCDKLNYIKCLATNINASGCTESWVDGVSSTGTFIKSSSMNDWPRGISGIPNNWTIQNA